MARFTLENGLPLKQLTPAAMALLQTHPWPGNVDQLRSVVEQAILYTDERRLGPAAFAELLEEPADAGTQHNQSQDERQSRDERVNQHESVPSIEVVDGKWRTLARSKRITYE